MVSDKEVGRVVGKMGKHEMMQMKALLKISMASAFVEETGICLSGVKFWWCIVEE